MNDGTTLVKYITSQCPYSDSGILETRKLIITDVSGRMGTKHVIVHQIHSKLKLNDSTCRTVAENMAVTVTFLDSYGKPMQGFNRCLFYLCRLTEYIYINIKEILENIFFLQ